MATRGAFAALWLGFCSAVRLDSKLREASHASSVRPPREQSSGSQLDGPDAWDPSAVLRGCEGLACVEKYAAFEDGAFKWKIGKCGEQGSRDGMGWSMFTLSLTSQAWMPRETHRATWQHQIEIVVPDSFDPGSKNSDVAVFFVEHTLVTYAATEMAIRTGAITVALTEVPNGGLDFPPSGHYSLATHDENDLQAWSWRQFANDSSHPEWPIEMPFMKAVVRAMDAVVAYTHKLGAGREVNRFILTGYSKRATATYMAAAIDDRVAGIIPVTLMLDCYGAWQEFAQNIGGIVPVMQAFENQGVLNFTDDQVRRLSAIIDPISYLERIRVPILAIIAGADDFFPPDATRRWWGRVPGPKTMFVYGNGRHLGYERINEGAGGRINEGAGGFLHVAAAYVSGVLSGSWPEIDWSIDEEDGSIAIRQVSNHTPTAVTVFGAKSFDSKMRDFRGNDLKNNNWLRYGPLKPLPGDGRAWLAASPENVKKLNQLWFAFYVEFEYEAPRPGGPPFRLTTEVSVVPNTRPFPNATFKERRYHEPVYQRN